MLKYLRKVKLIDYLIPKNFVLEIDGKKVTGNKNHHITLAEYLEKQMQKRDLSLVELSNETRIGLRELDRYINKGYKPLIRNKKKLCNYFGISRKDLESML